MMLPQRDNFIECIKRTDALLEQAVINNDIAEVERLRQKLKAIVEKV